MIRKKWGKQWRKLWRFSALVEQKEEQLVLGAGIMAVEDGEVEDEHGEAGERCAVEEHEGEPRGAHYEHEGIEGFAAGYVHPNPGLERRSLPPGMAATCMDQGSDTSFRPGDRPERITVVAGSWRVKHGNGRWCRSGGQPCQ